MIESGRVSLVVSEIRSMSAADMKLVARFGKVREYSQQYKDLKESLRSMLVMARNIHGIELDEAFADIEPINFTGMIPNETFNKERKKIVQLGEDFIEALENVERRQGRPLVPLNSSDDDMAGSEGAVRMGPPKIFVSESRSSQAGLDLKRCLETSDCEILETAGVSIAHLEYFPDTASDEMQLCNGAMICLMDPFDTQDVDDDSEADDEEDKPKKAPSNAEKAKERSRIAKNALFELGMCLGLFPDRTFFVVQDNMVKEIPTSLHDLISFQTDGGQLSFDDGQKMVQAFKQINWA